MHLVRGQFMYRSRDSHPTLPAWTWLPLAGLLALVAAGSAAPPAATPTPAPAPAATDPLALDKKLLAEAKNGSQIMANLTHLSDVIGPRLTGSAALKQANEWAAEKMRVYGLSNVHLEGWTIPVGWERGSASVRIIEPNNGRSLTVAAMGWTPGTKGRITGDVVVLKARNSAELAAYKGKLKNAIVLRNAPATIRPVTEKGSGFERPRPSADGKDKPKTDAKPETPPPPRPERSRAMAFQREMMEFLRTEGAAVLLMDASKPHGLLNMTGGWRGDDRVSGGEPLPSLFVVHEHYALLHRLASRPEPARTRVEVEINNKFIPGPVAVYNTVGEIRGAEKPNEFIVLGAHLDSWDLGHGTTDNGTGSCVVLEAARIFELERHPAAADDSLRAVHRRGAGVARLARLRQEAPRRDGENVDGAGPRHRHRPRRRHRSARTRVRQADPGEGTGVAEGTWRDGD